MGLHATSHTVIELDIPYAKKEIEGFSELYSIITKQLDLAFMGGQDAEEFDRLWVELFFITDEFKTKRKLRNEPYTYDFKPESIRAINLFKNILDHLYDNYKYILEYLMFSPMGDSFLDEKDFVFGFEIGGPNEVIKNIDKWNKLTNDIKCSVETYVDIS